MPSSARAFFDHLEAVLEVVDLGVQALVGQRGLGVGFLLVGQLGAQLAHVAHAATPGPELELDDQQQHGQDDGDDAQAHGRGFRRSGQRRL